jgi:type II secretory pathway component PulK
MTRTRHSPLTTHQSSRPGSVLIAVLIVVVVLSLVAYRFTDAMSAQRRAAQRSADAAQARVAAVSGVHWAAAALADPDTFYNVLYGDPSQDNEIFADQVYWTDPNNPKRQARFRIVAVVPGGSGFEQRSAVVDEGGKLNINAMILQDPTGVALYNALKQIPNMTPETAANIVDYVDEDSDPGLASNGEAPGAENETYSALGYQAKNGPLNTLDELLLVKGVTPALLYGTDQNQNGAGDDGEGDLDRGWSAYLTVYGRETSVNSSGQLKIWINGDQNADDLRNIYAAMLDSGIDQEIAAFIVGVKLLGVRNLVDVNAPPVLDKDGNPPPAPTVMERDAFIEEVEKRLESAASNGQQVNSVAQLAGKYLTIRAASGKNGATIYNSPLNSPDRMAELLEPLLDKIATKEEVELIPRLNVNAAPREVIAGLPGLEAADVDAIMSARDGADPTELGTTGAWLICAAGLTPQKYQAIEKYVTGTSMVYRVQALGYITGGGPVSRVEAVIDTNLGMPRIVYFRDLGSLDNPRGFPHPDRQAQQGMGMAKQ